MTTHFGRLIGEVAEKLHIDALEVPCFWTKQKTQILSPPVNITVSEITEKIGKEMDRLDLFLSTMIHDVETVQQDIILSASNLQE